MTLRKLLKKIYYFFKLKAQPPQNIPRDTLIGKVSLGIPTKLEIGNKVICDRGIANIKAIKGDWVVLTYGYKQKVERKTSQVWQYVVGLKTLSGETKKFPLSFADYEYIDQSDRRSAYFHITKRGYAKLTNEERASRLYLYHFNTKQSGRAALAALHKEGLLVQQGDLITIKNK